MSPKYQPLLPTPSHAYDEETKAQKVIQSRNSNRTIGSIFVGLLVAAFIIFTLDGTTLSNGTYSHTIHRTGKAAPVVDLKHQSGSQNITNARVAFSTLLTGSGFKDEGPMDDDVYFTSTRVLCYQLLHAPQTRTTLDAPFLVLTTPNVRKDKIDRLKEDGATVIPVEFIQADWVKTNISTWQFVLSKLHLWQLTQFDLLAFFDTDHVLVESMDGIFTDPAVVITKNKKQDIYVKTDEAPQPDDFVMAGTPEMTKTHEYPPIGEPRDFYNIHYLEAGLFVMRPDKVMYDHLRSVLNIKDRFVATLPEQNLFNYVYRRDGNMPWLQLAPTWSSHFPFMKDIEKGAKSVHDKYWFPSHEEMRPFLVSMKDEMQAFYEQRQQRATKASIKV